MSSLLSRVGPAFAEIRPLVTVAHPLAERTGDMAVSAAGSIWQPEQALQTTPQNPNRPPNSLYTYPSASQYAAAQPNVPVGRGYAPIYPAYTPSPVVLPSDVQFGSRFGSRRGMTTVAAVAAVAGVLALSACGRAENSTPVNSRTLHSATTGVTSTKSSTATSTLTSAQPSSSGSTSTKNQSSATTEPLTIETLKSLLNTEGITNPDLIIYLTSQQKSSDANTIGAAIDRLEQKKIDFAKAPASSIQAVKDAMGIFKTGIISYQQNPNQGLALVMSDTAQLYTALNNLANSN